MGLLSFQAHNQPRAGSVAIILIVQKGETEEQGGEEFAQMRVLVSLPKVLQIERLHLAYMSSDRKVLLSGY